MGVTVVGVRVRVAKSYVDPDQEFMHFIWSETLHSACYIHRRMNINLNLTKRVPRYSGVVNSLSGSECSERQATHARFL